MNTGIIAAPTIACVKATSGANKIWNNTAIAPPQNPVKIAAFNKSFEGGVKVYLSTNYRSKKNIVDISKNLILNTFALAICLEKR